MSALDGDAPAGSFDDAAQDALGRSMAGDQTTAAVVEAENKHRQTIMSPAAVSLVTTLSTRRRLINSTGAQCRHTHVNL